MSECMQNAVVKSADISDPEISTVREERHRSLKELVDSGQLNYLTWEKKFHLLQEAIKNKHTEIAKLLLKNCSEVRNRVVSGDSLPSMLEEHDAERFISGDLATLLQSTVTSGDAEILKMLLDKGISEVGKPLLHVAIQNNKIPIIKLLLNREAKVNAKDDKGMTPLDIAIRTNNIQIVALLLNKGADPNSTDTKGITPLHLASTPQSPDPILTPLHRAVRKGCQEITKLLLDKNAAVDIKTKNGMTPLHIAVLLGCERIAEDLLNHGASINSISTFGGDDYVLLHLAIQRGHSSLVKLLLKHGASVHVKNKDGKTALELALEKRHTMIIVYVFMSLIDINRKSDNHHAGHHAVVVLDHHADVVDKMSLLDTVAGFEMEYTNMFDHVLESARADLKHLYNRENLLSLLLQAAVKRQYKKIVQHFLNYGVDVDTSETLHAAAKIEEHSWTSLGPGPADIVELLIKYGADVNAKDKHDKTPIFYAVESNSFNITKMLLTNGANITGNYCLLKTAVKKTNIAIVEMILQHDSDIDIDCRDKYGNTALHCTMWEQKRHVNTADAMTKANIAKLLLNKGADVNARSVKGVTPLHAAAREGCKEMALVLLKYNADVNAADEIGMTPLHLSASQGSEEICKMLLEKKADVNAKDSRGLTALHIAFENRRVQAVRLLLNSGSDINITDEYGNTALHFAGLTRDEAYAGNCNYRTIANAHCRTFTRWIRREVTYATGRYCWDDNDNANKRIAQMLLRKGAHVDARNKDGLTPLHAAAGKGYVEVASVLLDHHADVNAADDNGIAPLYLSVVNRNTAICKMLLMKDANINAVSKNGSTALHYASEMGNERAVDLLLQHGADVDSRTVNGRTALHFASERADAQVVIVLLRYGADINITCDQGLTPLDFLNYVSNRGIRVAEIFKQHIVKMKAANRCLSEKNLRLLSSGSQLSSFENKCEEEIDKMRSAKISSDVSFYDILTKDVNRLAIYSRNESIVKALESGDYKEKFPIYCNMINNSFKRGPKRDVLLNPSISSLNSLIGYTLPDVSSINIFTYLNDKDLENLIESSPDTVNSDWIW